MNKNSKAVVSMYTQRLNGLRMYKDSKTKVVVEGKAYKLSQVIAAYQASLDARALANAKRKSYEAALADRNVVDDTTNAIEEVLKAWVTAQFGLESQEALEFGFAPKKNRTKASKKPKAAPPAAQASAPPSASPSGSTPTPTSS
jgi:hypothetical protein